MKWKKKKFKGTLVLFLAAAGLLIGGSRFLALGGIDLYAVGILKKCAKDSSRTSCYDREILKLFSQKKVTMEGAFAVTEKIQEKDKTYLYCHTLGHGLADIETKRDPDKWLDVVARCPALSCNNGCPHGAIQRRFKGSEVLTETEVKEIMPELKIVCEPRAGFDPTEVEKFMCYHSLGHLAMYITGADVDASIQICRALREDVYQTCVQGVFMIIYQSLDPEDEALVAAIKPEKEDIPEFCKRFSGLEHIACRTEAWIFSLEELRKPSGVVDFCAFTKGGYGTQWCYTTALGLAPLQLLNTQGVEAVADYCLGMPEDKKAPCFAFLATDWVQDEPDFAETSVSFCKLAEERGLGETCWDDLLFFSKWSFHKGSEEWEKYCNAFDEPQKSRCFSGDVPNNSIKWAD